VMVVRPGKERTGEHDADFLTQGPESSPHTEP
jgi:hypothetical protein